MVTPIGIPPDLVSRAWDSRMAVPAVMTSSTTSIRCLSMEDPTSTPPSPWSFASFRL